MEASDAPLMKKPLETGAEACREPNSPRSFSTWRQRYLRGWRFGILWGFALTIAVLVVNTAVLATFSSIGRRNGIANENTLFEGDCDTARELNVGIHLAINLLSTALLAASNYAMQCLVAPTRFEIDAAHAKKRWLDIGVPSFRNIWSVKSKRLALWAVLFASSLPLHLLFNSAVYFSLIVYDYVVLLADEPIASEANPQTPLAQLGEIFSGQYDPLANQLNAQINNGSLTRLTVDECIDAYATQFQTKYGNVVVVLARNDTANGSANKLSPRQHQLGRTVQPGQHGDPGFWICGLRSATSAFMISEGDGQLCTSKAPAIDRSNWRPANGARAQYCLAESKPEHCRLRYSPYIMGVVIACNALKALVLLITLWLVRENPVITIGDAISSFLRRADDATAGLCLMGKHRLGMWSHAPQPAAFSRRTQRLSMAASNRRWRFCMALYAGVLVICLVLFIYGLSMNNGATAKTMFALDLGAVVPESFIGGTGWRLPSEGAGGVVANVLVANCPQLILSGIYYTYNGLFTCFALAMEWNQYAAQPKGLRLSVSPRGAQRSTHFLQLPYRYACPLILLSLVLHWLCSQSIFLASIEVSTIAGRSPYRKLDWRNSTRYSESSYNSAFTGKAELVTCGYSPKAILLVIIFGLVMMLSAFGMGRRKISGSVPMASSCSASISAMCHLPRDEFGEDAVLVPLRWGVTSAPSESCDEPDVGHCSFSGRDVSEPIEGRLYAGI